MKLADAVTFERRTWLGGGVYVARVGTAGPCGEGRTKEDALQGLVQGLTTYEENRSKRAVCWSKDGSMWLLSWANNGWLYERFPRGADHGSVCLLATKSFRNALESMEAHIAQYDLNS